MKIRTTKPNVPEVDMTPMIDIVFQLIAFFMVITNFEQTQADERVKLPKNELAKPPEVKREHMLTLNVGFNRDDDGRKLHEEPRVLFNGNEILIDDMRRSLLTERRFFEAIEVPLEDVTVQIRADAEVKMGQVQELIQLCQDPEIQFVRFALAATQEVK